MTQDEVEEAILQLWKGGWDALHGTDPDVIPYFFDEEAGDTSDSWVRLAINFTSGNRATQGKANGKYDNRGIIMVQVFGPPDAGGQTVAQLCQDAREVLRDKRVGSLVTYEATPGRKADSGDPRWAMRVVTVPFCDEEQV